MSSDPMGKRRGAGKAAILIVDDHEAVRAALRKFVQQAFPRCAVYEAADGAQALDLCCSRRPRLVLMDVVLPDANGIELTRQIREVLPDTEVVIVSQYAADVYFEQAHAVGAFAYITKDKVYRDLLPTIARALGTVGATVSD